MSANSVSRSVREIQNIALGEENTLFATEKCVMDNGRPVAKESEPGHQDGVSRCIAQKSLFSLPLKLGMSNSGLENKAMGCFPFTHAQHTQNVLLTNTKLCTSGLLHQFFDW